MGGRRLVLSTAICLVALVAASCSEGGDTDAGREEASRSAAPADFMHQVEELCVPVADEQGELEDAEDQADFEEAVGALARAEQKLARDLRDLDPPPELEEGLDAYVRALEEYSEAEQAAGEGATEAESLQSVVEAAEADVRLEEAATTTGLPDECPPPASVDVHNTLFVARANLECHDLIEDVGGEPFDPPRTAKEVALMIDIARRLTAGIAGAVEDSATPGMDKSLVKKVVKLNKKRFHAIDALVETIRGGDYRTYREAGRKLAKVSRKADRRMLSLGLVYCAKAFSLVPL